MVAIPTRSPSSGTWASTTCRARRSACPSPGSRWRRRSSAARTTPPPDHPLGFRASKRTPWRLGLAQNASLVEVEAACLLRVHGDAVVGGQHRGIVELEEDVGVAGLERR